MGRNYKKQLNKFWLSSVKVFQSRWSKICVFGIVVLSSLLWWIPLPDPLFNNPYSTTLRSSDGRLLSATIADDQQWRFPPSDSISYKFQQAIRLFEDEYFYYHPGINPISLFRASWQNFEAGKIVSGGSTITMQTIRMAYGNQPRTYGQKIKEVMAALKLDLLYSKRAILIFYADNAPFGGNLVGVKSASWRYFGRSLYQLSWAETAFLAILPNNPSSVFSASHSKICLEKRNRLLDKLCKRGIIDEDELFLAKQEPVPTQLMPLPNFAQHLLFRSYEEGRKGMNIITSLDCDLQNKLNEKVNSYSKRMAQNRIYNAAALIVEKKSGKTLAYTGNVESSGNNGQDVDIITSQRSPGSLLKPILYASALDEGFILPKQFLPDIPIFYQGFAPKNFDKKFRGVVPADQALTSSLNVPFVYLLKEYGYERFHQKLKNLGMKSLNKPAGHYGLSIILGGAETSLWEITGIYASMVRSYFNYKKNTGLSDYHENYYIISDSMKALNEQSETVYLSAASLGHTFRAMQQLRRPEQEKGWQFFGSARPIAWKTGTSFGFRDAWAVGFNNKYVVGVWLGNADGEGRPGLTGILTASPLMFDVFDLLDGDADFNDFYGFDATVCLKSGMRANECCPETKNMVVPEKSRTGNLCTYHQIIHVNSDSSKRVNSSCYPVQKMESISWFIIPPVQAWYYKKYHTDYIDPPPYQGDCMHFDEQRVMEMIYPQQFTKVYIPNEQDGKPGKVIFEAAHIYNDLKIYWHLDEEYLGSTKNNHQMGIKPAKGKHILTLIDEEGNKLTRSFEVIN